MSDAILTATPWKSNAELIVDVAKLGYLDGSVLDVTYGLGTFWKIFRPECLVACDLNPEKSPIGYSVDYTAPLPFALQSFDSVVMDPPYKMNGKPTPTVDARYGVEERRRWQDRMADMRIGVWNCSFVAKKYLLVKCMDQVVSGQKVWQTYAIHNTLSGHYGWQLTDQFDMLISPRPQPEGRRQIHTQQNRSSLLVFERKSN